MYIHTYAEDIHKKIRCRLECGERIAYDGKEKLRNMSFVVLIYVAILPRLN